MAMILVTDHVEFLAHLSPNAHLSTSVLTATIMVHALQSFVLNPHTPLSTYQPGQV
jgi:hypothetical protein